MTDLARAGLTLTRPTATTILATVDNPVNDHFRVYAPAGTSTQPSDFSCVGHRTNTSVTAALHGCNFATNGGFFDMGTGACHGTLASQGVVLQLGQEGTESPISFGLTKNGSYVIGQLSEAQVWSYGFQQIISGNDWLVRDGQSVVGHTNRSGFGDLIAPRTAIGSTVDGKLLFYVVDGCETTHQGMTLSELGEAFQKLGAHHAVNLDGGGSTTATGPNGVVIDKPTCDDTGRICERTVTSITCIV